MPADHAHTRLFGIGVLDAIGEPVRHAVAEHQHVALGHAVAFFRRRRAGIIFAHDWWPCARRPPIPTGLRRLLLKRREDVVAEPGSAATLLRLWPLPLRQAAEIKELG